MTNRFGSLVVGALMGAVVGAAVAWSITEEQKTARPGAPIRLQHGAADVMKVGIAMLAVIRQVSALFRQG